MGSELLIVSECCPVGCGIDVVLLRAREATLLFAYCNLCGGTWLTPDAVQPGRGLYEITPPWIHAPRGVELPSRGDAIARGFGEAILRTMPISAWTTTLDSVNGAIARELSNRR
jgi:hypothetical protein